jgi:exopolyphosphatase / guanosine-5'-triphosphate,3'-diphosphate pyrophosphatase
MLREAHPHATRELAALDLGSNMFRLVVGGRNANEVAVREKLVEVVAIARSLEPSGAISSGSIERGKSCLERFRQHLARLDIQTVHAVGTAAFRNAPNGAIVAREFGAALGHPVEIISAEREAKLAVRGASLACHGLETFRAIDIGGASTEYSEVTRGNVFSRSFDIGAISLHERVPTTMFDEERHIALERCAREALRPLGELSCAKGTMCCAIGGSAVALAALKRGLTYEEQLRAEGPLLGESELRTLFDELISLDPSRRAALLNISEAHCELIVAGYFLLKVAMELAGASEVVATGSGVAEGLLSELVIDGR